MTVQREWAIPVALGLMVAAALAAVPGGDEGSAPSDGDGTTASGTNSSAPAAVSSLLHPFLESRGLAGSNATFLVVAPKGEAAAMQELNRSATGLQGGSLDWTGGNDERGVAHKLAFYTKVHDGGCPSGMTCPAAGSPGWLLPTATVIPEADVGPRVGIDGYNGTRATIYVFDSQGRLAATNDAEENWSKFQGSPTTLESTVWYIGANETAPNGTKHVPSFARELLPQLRPVLQGLPVGAVTSTQSNAYAFLYGTLFVTARIDALVYAP